MREARDPGDFPVNSKPSIPSVLVSRLAIEPVVTLEVEETVLNLYLILELLLQ